MTSQARIDANRLNAQKSTGPRSKEGKDRSRCNALQHGLRAVVLDVPGEREVIAARVLDWSDSFRTASNAERWLVARAAAASVKLDRCTEIEADRIDERVRKVRSKLVDGRRDEAERLAPMVTDPEALARLRATAIGCDVLLGLVDELEESFEAPGGWDMEEPLQLATLLNIPADASAPHPRLIALFEDAGRAGAGDGAAGRRVREHLARCRAELEARCEELWEEVDGPELRAAMSSARFDSSKLGARMQRYEAMHSADLNRCLRLLKAGVAAPNEPNMPTQAPANQELTPEEASLTPAPAASSPAASSIHDPAIQEPSPPTPSPAAPNEPNAPAQTSFPVGLRTMIQEHATPIQDSEAACRIPDPAIQHPTATRPAPAAPNEPNITAQPEHRTGTSVSMTWRQRLASDPSVSRTCPVVRGTRITAAEIVDRLAAPDAPTPAELVAEYGGALTEADVEAACRCLASRMTSGTSEE